LPVAVGVTVGVSVAVAVHGRRAGRRPGTGRGRRTGPPCRSGVTVAVALGDGVRVRSAS